jgi:hypothetical protein
MLGRVALVRTDISEELSASTIRVTNMEFFMVTAIITSNLICSQQYLQYNKL